MLDHDHTGGAEAVRGETLGDHLVGMYVCSIILGQPRGTRPGVRTPRGYGYGLGPGHPGVYPCPSLVLLYHQFLELERVQLQFHVGGEFIYQ